MKSFMLMPLMAALSVCAADFRTIQINDAPFEMPALKEYVYPERNFPITDYGAKPDGTKCTDAIAKAMEACEKAGGGHVVVPAGKWLTGAVHFRSNCDLRLEEGAVLESTDDPADYPEVHTTWEGIECYNYSPLFFAYGCENVAITGKGMISPRMAFWRGWFTRPPSHMAATEQLYYWCSTNAPVASRRLLALKDAHMRPHLIQFNRCRNVMLDGFKIRESPFWMIHLYHSENCIVRNLDTYAHGHNNDGVDVDMTKNVLIENCHFDQGDDGVVLKAGRNADAWRLDRCTENVVIRDCDMVKSHSLLGIGSELSGGVRNVWMTRCRVADTYSMLRIKTGRRRGGFVENVWIDHCTGKQMIRVFNIFTDYCAQWGKFPDFELRYTRIRNINVSDLTAECADNAIQLHAAVQLPAEHIRIRNVKVGRVTEKMTDIHNCLDVKIDGLELSGAPTEPRCRSLKVLACGNWLGEGVRREMAAVAKSMGLDLDLAAGESDELLKSREWDAVVVRDLDGGKDIRKSRVWKLAPKAEIVAEDAVADDFVESHRRNADFAADRGFRLIPTAVAAQLNGGASDYLTALTWVAKLFGADVMRCEYRPVGVSESISLAIRSRVMSAVRCEPIPERFGGPKLKKSVEDGIRRMRIIGIDDGEINEFDYDPSCGLRVSFVLRPTPVSHIRCELRLADPDKWDGRFWGNGSGGWAGVLGCSREQNTASMTCDLGTSRSHIEQNPADIEICRDFGWRATHLATVAAKRLARIYYPDRRIKASYFKGASTGGGQGLCESQRYPEDYDGIISEVPGNDRLARTTPLVQKRRLMEKHGGKWFSEEEQKAIREAELAYFAKSEPSWAHGEFIVDPRTTQEKIDGCWREIVSRNPSLADREALWRGLFEPVYVGSRRLEPGQMLGAEFNYPWTFIIEKYLGPRTPGAVSDEELLAFADNANHQFTDANLSAFKDRRGKIIMYVGLEDKSVPAMPVCEYYDSVVRAMGGLEHTQDFFRFFLEPGREHAGTVKTGWPQDVKRQIIDWVENGVAPESLVFPWVAKKPMQLRVTPYPEHKVTCEKGEGCN